MTLHKENLIDEGDFEEMLELASELAMAEGGMIVIHRKYCLESELKDSCSCNPLVIHPYTHVTEDELDGFDN